VDLARLDLSLDWRVLAAGITVTALTLAGAVAVPIGRFTRARLAGELIGSASTTSASSQRLRQTLLGLHVAATIVVLVAAGLFVRAVAHGFGAGAGFDIDRTAFVQVQVAGVFLFDATDMDARAARMAENTRRLVDGLRALPGVEVVAEGALPIGPDQASRVLAPQMVEARGERRTLRIGRLWGGPDLLAALGVPILKGRGLTTADAATRPPPVLITASLARALWPAEEPLGQTVSGGALDGPVDPGTRRGRWTNTIVGIVPASRPTAC
jgi:hypothetical protein